MSRSRTEDLAIADLQLDLDNARLRERPSSQPHAMVALAKQQGSKLFALAEHILEHGLDPSQALLVTPADDGGYRVLEGNRRLLVLKALDEPALIAPAQTAAAKRRWQGLSDRYQSAPINRVTCEVFDSEVDAVPFVVLRHTGERDGAGGVPWNSDEQNRYEARHDPSARNEQGQVVDFIEQHVDLSEAAQAGSPNISTNIRRLLETPASRAALGVAMSKGTVSALYPLEELTRILGWVAEELRTGRLKVGRIYDADDRKAWAETIPDDVRPDPAKRLPEPVPLSDLTSDAGKADTAGKPRAGSTGRKGPGKKRTTLAPTHPGYAAQGRANDVLREATKIKVADFPNSASLLLRTFAEFTINHGTVHKKLMTHDAAVSRNKSFAAKLTDLVEKMREDGDLTADQAKQLRKVAGGAAGVAANSTTFNGYVHSKYAFPLSGDLISAWDEMDSLFAAVWSW